MRSNNDSHRTNNLLGLRRTNRNIKKKMKKNIRYYEKRDYIIDEAFYKEYQQEVQT